MTVPATPRRAGPFYGDGSATQFPFSFKVYARSDVLVTVALPSGDATPLVLDTDYSVTLNLNQDTSPGGYVTYPISGSPLPNGGVLALTGNLDYTQPTDLPDGGAYRARNVETMGDRIVMLVQQVKEALSRTFTFPPTDGIIPEFPPVSERANRLLGFDSNGQFVGVLPVSGSAAALSLDLADASAISKGDALIAVKQPFAGAVARTQHQKNAETITVTDFGTITGVAANDTAILTAALNAALYVEIPAGLVCRVNSGLQYWRFFGAGQVWENGRMWSLPSSPQTGVLARGYVARTYGKYESAAAASFTANSNVGQTKENTQINGTTTSALAVRNDYDHAAFFASCYSFTPDLLDGSSTYTATTVTNTAIGTLFASGALKPGMYILTQHATPCLGEVQSVSGNIATVDGWYLSSTGAATTPANSVGAIVNPNNKTFGGNFEVSATGNGTTTGANRVSGLEIGVTTATSGTAIAGTYGIDLVSRGGSYMDLGYQIRGKRNYSFYSNPAGGASLYAFRSEGDGRALSVVDATVAPIEVQVGGGANTVFGVAPSGALTISLLNSINGPLALNGNGQTMSYTGSANAGYTQGMSGLATVHFIAKNTAQNRSINAAGTINANGTDYAEYERNNGLVIAKGDVVGFKADGTLTLTFSEAIRFAVKTTDPSFVGGDSWTSDEAIGMTRPEHPVLQDGETEAEYTLRLIAFEEAWAVYQAALEAARLHVDRIAYCGKVPVNVLGATPGHYLVAAAAADGSITASPVPAESATFAQYQRAIGRVNRILEDGRAEVAVIVH